ncbi:hypothetical protein VSDG_05315 [Cytospora chrysosperma]|uniref:Uncharacterized protein n=1 Tax=Cytospora chrysosperma TaxID=252740 RepID=A0A423VX10_CYTCH|nr:hypothetical protein VSDG_05315 [Valsa sordida]
MSSWSSWTPGMGCMCCKEDEEEQQNGNNTHAPILLAEWDGDALAAELFSTPNNPNRRRAPPQDSRPHAHRHHHHTALGYPTMQLAGSTAMTRPGHQREHQVDPGQVLSGIPLIASMETLPQYEERGENDPDPVVEGGGPDTAATGGGQVRRAGTGWSAASQSSGAPPSYHSVAEPRQAAWRSDRV